MTGRLRFWPKLGHKLFSAPNFVCLAPAFARMWWSLARGYGRVVADIAARENTKLTGER